MLILPKDLKAEIVSLSTANETLASKLASSEEAKAADEHSYILATADMKSQIVELQAKHDGEAHLVRQSGEGPVVGVAERGRSRIDVRPTLLRLRHH